jgi:hypothetical protein
LRKKKEKQRKGKELHVFKKRLLKLGCNPRTEGAEVGVIGQPWFTTKPLSQMPHYSSQSKTV